MNKKTLILLLSSAFGDSILGWFSMTILILTISKILNAIGIWTIGMEYVFLVSISLLILAKIANMIFANIFSISSIWNKIKTKHQLHEGVNGVNSPSYTQIINNYMLYESRGGAAHPVQNIPAINTNGMQLPSNSFPYCELFRDSSRANERIWLINGSYQNEGELREQLKQKKKYLKENSSPQVAASLQDIQRKVDEIDKIYAAEKSKLQFRKRDDAEKRLNSQESKNEDD